jgi:hypothetical protein
MLKLATSRPAAMLFFLACLFAGSLGMFHELSFEKDQRASFLIESFGFGIGGFQNISTSAFKTVHVTWRNFLFFSCSLFFVCCACFPADLTHVLSDAAFGRVQEAESCTLLFHHQGDGGR